MRSIHSSPMKSLPRISEAEWEIMCIVWEQEPITANEVIERLRTRNREWHPNTARTLLARLVQKKALAYQNKGRSYEYRALVSEKECVTQASQSFLTRFFDGSLKPMFAHFVQHQHLSPSELAELRGLLDEIDKKPTPPEQK